MQSRNTIRMLQWKLRNPLVKRKGNCNHTTVSPAKGSAKLKQIRWEVGIPMEVGIKEDRGTLHGGLTQTLDGLTMIKASHLLFSSRILHTLRRGSPTGQGKVKKDNYSWGIGIRTKLIGETKIRTTQEAPMCHLIRETIKETTRTPNRIIKGIKGRVASTITIREIKGRITNTTIIKATIVRTKVKDQILVNSTSDHRGVWTTWSMI